MKDKAKGKLDQGKGKVKESIGKLGGDRSTEWGGKIDQAKGKVEEGVGDVKGALAEKEDAAERAEEQERSDLSR
jgi:uncharacterized protein YjbJ (UPF0337 family)